MCQKTKDKANGPEDCFFHLYFKDSRLSITTMPSIFNFYVTDVAAVRGNLEGRGG
jgi:hypothetical protein